MTALNTPAIVDGAARVIADVVGGHIFAAGVTQSVTDAAPQVVPLADDISEADYPVVTVALGSWEPTLQPGNERLKVTLVCSIWRHRLPLGDNTNALYRERDLLADGWLEHSKAYLTETRIQSAMLMGGPGIVPRELPGPDRTFLTLPFSIEVVCNRAVSPKPA